MILKSKTSAALFILALAALSTFADAEMVPKGWIKAGSAPQLYEVGVLSSGKENAAYIAGLPIIRNEAAASGFGTLMQTISAAAYGGKRVRFAADVRAENIGGWAGLWMRVDGAQGKVLAFDNMQKHPIKGTSEPKKYTVVLDVPPTAQALSFGILLDGGAGRATISSVQLDTVGKDVPVTSGPAAEPLPAKPRNLGFTE
jgi:hypothetical protein